MKALRTSASFAGILVLASVAFAQTVNNESKLQAAIQSLSTGTLYFETNGFETIGKKTTTLKDTLFWYSTLVNEKWTYKAELIQTRNNVMERRLVADGEWAWMFDFNRHEYIVINYATKGSAQLERLMGFLQAYTSGPGAYNARLLRETRTSGLRTWMPGYSLISVEAPTKDPLTGTIYTPADNTEYLAYGLDRDDTTRTLVFELFTQDTTTSLSQVTYADVPSKKKDHSTTWTMTVLTGPTLDMNRFLPETQTTLSTWQPIAAVSSNKFKSGN